jgi:hypothetical protein
MDEYKNRRLLPVCQVNMQKNIFSSGYRGEERQALQGIGGELAINTKYGQENNR